MLTKVFKGLCAPRLALPDDPPAGAAHRLRYTRDPATAPRVPRASKQQSGGRIIYH